jgi:phage recombination protein Bet
MLHNKRKIMNTELTPAKLGIEESVWNAIRNSIFPGAKEESCLMAWDYCKARKLDILKKPCHIVGMSVKNAQTNSYEWRDVIMPSIAECRITAHRTGEYAGQDAPLFGETISLKIGKETHQVPEFCTITVYRMIQGQRMACLHTEYFEEACGTTKDGELNSMWRKRKRGQLAKCAEAGALRKAFPEEMGGIITADEIEGAEEQRNVTPTKSRLRDTPIEPFSPPNELNAISEPPDEPEIPANGATLPPEGRQKKERIQRDGKFWNIKELTTEQGTPFWEVTIRISGKDVEFMTFSKTLSNRLDALQFKEPIRITVLETAQKGIFQLENFMKLTAEEGII